MHKVPSDKVVSRFVYPHKCRVLIAHPDRLGVPIWLALLSSLFTLMGNVRFVPFYSISEESRT